MSFRRHWQPHTDTAHLSTNSRKGTRSAKPSFLMRVVSKTPVYCSCRSTYCVSNSTGRLPRFGLMQRTKVGVHADMRSMSSSRDARNCPVTVSVCGGRWVGDGERTKGGEGNAEEQKGGEGASSKEGKGDKGDREDMEDMEDREDKEDKGDREDKEDREDMEDKEDREDKEDKEDREDRENRKNRWRSTVSR